MFRIVAASYAGLMGLLICAAPMVAGAWFAFRPAERLLALMRPLTLAGLFSALCSFLLSLLNGLHMVSVMKNADLAAIQLAAIVLMEGLAPVVASFACLTVAWACVAIGMRRS